MTTQFHEDLIGAWASWGPTLSPAGEQVAFISDRRGVPELWVQDVPTLDGDVVAPAALVTVTDDPVCSVTWSADGAWLACTAATDGGVRTQVWVVRPDGTGARHLAGGGDQHATLGPWTRSGHRLVITTVGGTVGDDHRCDLVDPTNGEHEPLARGRLVDVLDLSADERFALLRDGLRGARFCVTLDRTNDVDHPLLTYPETGSTETGLLRPAPPRARRIRRQGRSGTDRLFDVGRRPGAPGAGSSPSRARWSSGRSRRPGSPTGRRTGAPRR